MLVSYQWLKEYVRDMPSPEKLQDLLTRHSFEVSGMPSVGDDTVFSIDVLPNRADALSHRGIAREIAAITATNVALPNPPQMKIPKMRVRDLRVEDATKSGVLRYTALYIEGLHVGPSPEWMQKRLAASGVRPLNVIVDVTNYAMLDTGQPFHAFDYAKIQGKLLRIRGARKGEKMTTLDGESRELPPGALIIEDKKQIIDLAGIMGGAESAVDGATNAIVLQAAVFDPARIRQTEKEMHHRTEASFRYGYGVDPELAPQRLCAAAELLLRCGGPDARIQGIIDQYPRPQRPRVISVSLENTSRLLGMPIEAKRAEGILTRLGCDVEINGDMMAVRPPSFRKDLAIPEDISEEIGRIEGYEKIPAVFPIASLIPPTLNASFLWEEKIRDILVGSGLTEVIQYAFVGKEDAERFYPLQKLLRLRNPASDDKYYLRPNLVFGMVDLVKRNMRTQTDFAVFEIGRAFERSLARHAPYPIQEGMRCVFMFAHHDKKDSPRAFYEAKGTLELLLQRLGIADFVLREASATSKDISQHAFWHQSRGAEVRVNDTHVGFIGEIHPSLLAHHKIPMRVAMCDLAIETLLPFATEDVRYKIYSRYPSAVRDISVLVPVRTKVEDVLNIMEASGGELVRDIDLFDLYEGSNLPTGRKSMAFHIVYQSDERTLTDEEVDRLQQRMMRLLEKNEWEVRKI
ncbi:MAG: phenylalanine--tRNA ligase subunit beta [Parcubacteria group bacterium]|nr:phenylalanine--tRNA ligase subunit beta [Parcubacteria group bacterium]